MAQNFSTRMFLPTAVLILLSVATAAEEAKRCYWCGPLAEQVHRSQRTPPCGQELQETTCDKGYSHCAVVATSPPYVESRLCVKFYQDECYSLYCNSSKTWRMICPCQGSLCNGQNTDRETTAFATLAKIVDKSKRSKRSLISHGFLSSTSRQKVTNQTITSRSEKETTHSAMFFEEEVEGHIEIENTFVTADSDVIEPNDSENEDKNIEENTVKQTDDFEMQGDQPITEQIETNVAVTTAADDDNLADTNGEHNEIIQVTNDMKLDSATPSITIVEESSDDNAFLTVALPVEFLEYTETKGMPTLTSMIPTSIEIELSVVHNSNAKDNLPPPEALQQNISPDKVSVPTTMATVETTTNDNHIETTTHSHKDAKKKNLDNEIAKNSDKYQGANAKNSADQISIGFSKMISLINLFLFIYIHETYDI